MSGRGFAALGILRYSPRTPSSPVIPLHGQALFFGLLVAACHAPGPGVPLPAPPAPPAPGVAASDTACTIPAGRAAGRGPATLARPEPVDPSPAPLPRHGAAPRGFRQPDERP